MAIDSRRRGIDPSAMVMPASSLFADTALIAGRTGPPYWADAVRFDIAADGSLAAVTAGAAADGLPRAGGPVVPGMPNLHSHAFQRALAGRTERAASGTATSSTTTSSMPTSSTAAAKDRTAAADTTTTDDSFWSWRRTMYAIVDRLDPDSVQAIAAQLYVEMLEAGYTAVGEFHYLHHDRDGRPYADPAEMAHRIMAAARDAGIGLTLLPVLYGRGGFDDRPVDRAQQRFATTPDRFLALVDAAAAAVAGDPDVAIGIAPHSLRAVAPDALRAACDGLADRAPTAPIHIHIAEQTLEVDACLAATGARPVEWLLAGMAVDDRWCAVHATHMTAAETGALARSGAVAGLCPTTEANLGDGLFPAAPFLAAGGAFGIGSDSHVSVSPIEELRWLEYGRRLVDRRRACLLPPGSVGSGSVGAGLWTAALTGGARALGRPVGRLAVGGRADLIVLDPDNPSLYGMTGDGLLDGLVFAGNRNPVRDVMVGGRWVVQDGRHARRHGIATAFRVALDRLAG